MSETKTAEKVVSDLNRELEEVLEETPAVPATVEPKDVAPVYGGEPGSIERMMEIALQNGGEQTLEILERLTALKNAEEDRRAKKEFAEHFAKMQREFVAVKKTKAGYNYKYATFGKLVEHFGPTIADNGFSHWFESEMLDEPKGWKRITLHITGWGHERTNHFDVPPIERPTSQSGKQTMNAVQALGAADTYGERYAFVAGYVLPILDEEDTDGVVEDDEALTAALKELERATTIKKLHELFSLHYKAAKTDRVRTALVDAKDQQKAVLQEIEDAATN